MNKLKRLRTHFVCNFFLLEVGQSLFDGTPKLINHLREAFLGGVLYHIVDEVEEYKLLLDADFLYHLENKYVL